MTATATLDPTTRIRCILDTMLGWPTAGASPADRRRRAQEVDRLQDELSTLRWQTAESFGAARGWKLTRTYFSTRTLARGGWHDGHARVLDGWPHHFTDHQYFYRWPGGRSAAVAGHPYDFALEPEHNEARAWATAHGLKVSFPDTPSWWFPGRTTLVLFERIAA